MFNKKITIALAGAACAILLPAAATAGGSYGFSFSTGPAFVAPPPIYVAPPPPPPVVYHHTHVYRPYPVSYYRPGPSFNFSYHSH